MLLLDYGCERRDYYRAERVDGTLICHYRHRGACRSVSLPRFAGHLRLGGFQRGGSSGEAAGLDLAVYTPQAHFLLACGLPEESRRGAGDAPAEQATAASALRRLLLPGEMGEYVKAMLLTRGLTAGAPAARARSGVRAFNPALRHRH